MTEIQRTFFQHHSQFRNLARRPTDPVNALVFDPVLFDGFAAPGHNLRYLNVVSHHLLGQVYSKGWTTLVLDTVGAIRRRR